MKKLLATIMAAVLLCGIPGQVAAVSAAEASNQEQADEGAAVYQKQDGWFTVWTDDANLADEGVSLKVSTITEGADVEKAAEGLDGMAALLRFSYEKNGQPVETAGNFYYIRVPGYFPDARVMWAQFYQINEDGSRIPLEAECIKNPPGSFFNDYLLRLNEPCDILMTGSYRRGDMNGNGELDAEDALLILKAVTKNNTLDSAMEMTADMDRDGEVTSDDALRVLKNIVGMAWDWRC